MGRGAPARRRCAAERTIWDSSGYSRFVLTCWTRTDAARAPMGLSSTRPWRSGPGSERAVGWAALAVGVIAPADQRSRRGRGTGVVHPRADRDKHATRRRRLTVPVRPPTSDAAVRPHPTDVLEARAYPSERVTRWGGLLLGVAAPAAHTPIRKDTARMKAAHSDLHKEDTALAIKPPASAAAG